MGKYGSRKLLVGLIVLVMGLGVTVAVGDIPPHLLQLLEVIFGGFIVGNSVSHIVNSKRPIPIDEPVREEPIFEPAPEAEIPPPPPQQVDLTPLMQGIMTVQEMLALIIRRAGIDKLPEPGDRK